jgi:hypothetical protein
MVLKDKLQNAYDDIAGINEQPLYQYYEKEDVEKSIKKFKELLNCSSYCKCGYNEKCWLCRKFDEIFGDFKENE